MTNETTENETSAVSAAPVDVLVMMRIIERVHFAGMGLPKVNDDSYEDGFEDALNYFAQEMKAKIQAT